MSLNWNTTINHENSKFLMARKAKSTSSFHTEVPNKSKVKGLKLGSTGRTSALKNRSNTPQVNRNTSTTSKKLPFKVEPVKLHKTVAVEVEPEDYSDIEQMHLCPEVEDDYEDIMPKSERITTEDLKKWLKMPLFPLLESPKSDCSFLHYKDEPLRCEFPEVKECDLYNSTSLVDIPFPCLSDGEDF